MQKFLLLNCKGLSLELLIMQVHENLNRLHKDPETADLEILSMNFVNTFEKPQKNSLDISPQANQPVIVYNCCVVLVKPRQLLDPDQLAKGIAERILDEIDPPAGSDTSPGPSPSEIETLKRFAGFTCEHKNLDPAKHSKAYKNPGMYYQICQDCGNEVWSEGTAADVGNDGLKKMFIVPPATDQLDARIKEIEGE
jgi:hypothetical protein